MREGIALDFAGVTRALGLFLLQRPRFFPNPNRALDQPSAPRARRLHVTRYGLQRAPPAAPDDGRQDTHGAIGHLSAQELADLIAFLESL